MKIKKVIAGFFCITALGISTQITNLNVAFNLNVK